MRLCGWSSMATLPDLLAAPGTMLGFGSGWSLGLATKLVLNIDISPLFRGSRPRRLKRDSARPSRVLFGNIMITFMSRHRPMRWVSPTWNCMRRRLGWTTAVFPTVLTLTNIVTLSTVTGERRWMWVHAVHQVFILMADRLRRGLRQWRLRLSSC